MPVNLAYHAYHLIWSVLDWLYPPDCGGCGKKGMRWCLECFSNCHVIGNVCCDICGDITAKEGVCQRCLEDKPTYNQVRSWTVYEGPVRNLIHRLKYRGDLCLGEALAKPLIADIIRIGWTIDLLVPVPLSLARFTDRGYNQAALIALPVAIGLKVPYHQKVLKKIIDTRSQVGLSYDERRKNLANTFAVAIDNVSEKRVLIIDDVTTSGATLNECAIVLKAAGAREVYGYTFARASHHKHAAHTDMTTSAY